MKFIYIPTKRTVYSLELWKHTCIYLSCDMFFTWYKCILTVITQCAGGQLCSEWFLLWRAGMETCTVRARWLVWGYLPLGPWGCTLVSVREGRLGGGMNSCALQCHLGTLENEGQFTSRVSGFYRHWKKNLTYGIPVPIQVPGKKKNQLIAFLYLSKQITWRLFVHCTWGLYFGGEFV